MKSFAEINLKKEILNAIKDIGFTEPTVIQSRTIPFLINSKEDIIATAQTGTGKTGAFGLPSIQLTNIEVKKPQTLILCPTRELCIQISNDLNTFSKYISGIKIVPVYGGSSMEKQIRSLKQGAHIIVGTPGRTVDMIKRKKLSLQYIDRVVLDEADEMLSMGFKDDLDLILSKTSDQKQVLLFSATMGKKILSITKKYMNNPIKIASSEINSSTKQVDHYYYMVQAKYRYEVLKRIADMNPNIYGIIFCRTRRETKEVSNKLMQDGYNADSLHGDLTQSQRDEVMDRFRKKRIQLLVATDVASRGIDVDSLSHIINYNFPDESEVYIHRSGRTGRAGKRGISILIINTREMNKIKAIEKNFKISFKQEKIPSGNDICTKQLFALIDKIEKVEVDQAQIEQFLPKIYKKLDWLSREELIKHFVSAEFNKFLSYYKNSKDLNLLSNRNDRKKDKVKSNRNKKLFSNIYINIGSKNKLNPSNLIGIINEVLKSDNVIIGKIQILKSFSFFEIDKKKEKIIIDLLNGKKIKGVSLIVQVAKEDPKNKPKMNNNRKTKKSFKKNKRKPNFKRK
ncbi:MAG: DEAD/DEAH box helicase [Candidatus Marinimicrobia bacterium]|nr:DEAD/DEAH box helicase [Candidatus Neomarinimicrobiota bacterium]|tara:strand:- start:13281 stop:14987 length:1707 start_codon:yes stop_codon:yes gene_type:complete